MRSIIYLVQLNDLVSILVLHHRVQEGIFTDRHVIFLLPILIAVLGRARVALIDLWLGNPIEVRHILQLERQSSLNFLALVVQEDEALDLANKMCDAFILVTEQSLLLALLEDGDVV